MVKTFVPARKSNLPDNVSAGIELVVVLAASFAASIILLFFVESELQKIGSETPLINTIFIGNNLGLFILIAAPTITLIYAAIRFSKNQIIRITIDDLMKTCELEVWRNFRSNKIMMFSLERVWCTCYHESSETNSLIEKLEFSKNEKLIGIANAKKGFGWSPWQHFDDQSTLLEIERVFESAHLNTALST